MEKSDEKKNNESPLRNAAIKLAEERGLEIHISDFDELPATSKSNMVSQVYSKSDTSQLEARREEMGKGKINKLIDSLKNQIWGKK